MPVLRPPLRSEARSEWGTRTLIPSPNGPSDTQPGRPKNQLEGQRPMKLVSFLRNNKPTWGVVVDGGVVDCGAKLGKKFPDLRAVIANRGLADAKKLAK